MLQRYADGTLDFELVCPISLLSRQLDVMDEYASLLRHRAKIEHVHLEKNRTPPPNKKRGPAKSAEPLRNQPPF